jgi:molecular chaperone HtpG
VRWESDGEGQYEIQAVGQGRSRHRSHLHLRDEDKEFLEPSRLRGLVRKYSDHLSIPIVLKERRDRRDGQSGQGLLDPPEVRTQDEDYQAFYKHLTHDSEDARAWAHNKVEGNIEYTSLLYLPKRAPFDLFEREQKGGIQLYVKRVFIMDKAAELLPPWLRFMRGLVDTADLPLNVSRELAAEQSHRREDQVGAGQALAGSARGSGGQQAGGIRRVLEDLRRGAEGRHHRRSQPERRALRSCCASLHGLE